MTTPTLRDFVAEALRLADENPEAVYESPNEGSSCYYTSGEAGGCCGCLFGQAGTNLGVDMAQFDHESAADVPTVGGVLGTLIALDEVSGTRFQLSLISRELAEAQGYQDRKLPWVRSTPSLKAALATMDERDDAVSTDLDW